MRFHFRLQRVLEIRELFEKEKQRIFSQALGKLKMKELEMMDLIAKKNAFAGNMGTASGMLVHEVAGHHQHLAELANTIEDIRHEIAAIEKEVEKKRQELLKATQERKAIEKLKEKRKEEHIAEVAAQEQAFLDEIAMRR